MFKMQNFNKEDVRFSDIAKYSFGDHKLFFNLNKEYLLTFFNNEKVKSWWDIIFNNALQDRDYQWFILQGIDKFPYLQLSNISHKILYMYSCPEKAFDVWSDIKIDLLASNDKVKKDSIYLIKNLYNQEQHEFLIKEIVAMEQAGKDCLILE